MQSFIGFICSWISFLLFNCYTFEIVIYMVVDKYTKDKLQLARDREEKRKQWLDECAILSVVAVILWIHHIPYFLLTMLFCTLTWSTTSGGLFAGRAISWFSQFYKDFADHEDSIHKVQHPRHPYKEFPQTFSMGEGEGFLPPPNVAIKQFSGPGRNGKTVFVRDVPEDGRSAAESRNRFVHPIKMMAENKFPYSNQPMPQKAKNYESLRAQFPVLSTHLLDEFPKMGSAVVNQTIFQPRGLENKRENLCFFNCVIQVLARSGSLLTDLIRVSAQLQMEDPVLAETVNIFAALTNPEPSVVGLSHSSSRGASALNTSNLRRVLVQAYNNFRDPPGRLFAALASLAGEKKSLDCLLQMPSSNLQKEQDVAEFLTWMLEVLHRTLIGKQKAIEMRMKTSHYRDILALWEKFNKPVVNEIDQLKQFHQQQLTKVHRSPSRWADRDHKSALVDLDWLAHMHPHRSSFTDGRSLTDDIFTGQLVFVTSCNKCQSQQVTTDIFKILPVAMPQDFNSRTKIEDCLESFMKIEKLCGPDSQSPCMSCLSVRSPLNGFVASSPRKDLTPQTLRSHSFFDIVSPIRKENDYKVFDDSQLEQISFDCDRQTEIARLPECLVIQLMRFRFNQPSASRASRLCTKVRVGTSLDVGPYLMQERRPSGCFFYQLYALIMHSSCHAQSISEGHYSTLVRTGTQTWHLFDDDNVKPVKNVESYLMQDHVQEDAYLLFYSRANS